MTYGADFRPGARCLPRHDTKVFPAIEEYERFAASLRSGRTSPSAAKMRRFCVLIGSGNTPSEAARLIGVPRANMMYYYRLMPAALTLVSAEAA